MAKYIPSRFLAAVRAKTARCKLPFAIRPGLFQSRSSVGRRELCCIRHPHVWEPGCIRSLDRSVCRRGQAFNAGRGGAGGGGWQALLAAAPVIHSHHRETGVDSHHGAERCGVTVARTGRLGRRLPRRQRKSRTEENHCHRCGPPRQPTNKKELGSAQG
jgi:hypothetical protein